MNDIFRRAFLDNATFFSLANKNYAEGADTALGVDGLTKRARQGTQHFDTETRDTETRDTAL